MMPVDRFGWIEGMRGDRKNEGHGDGGRWESCFIGDLILPMIALTSAKLVIPIILCGAIDSAAARLVGEFYNGVI